MVQKMKNIMTLWYQRNTWRKSNEHMLLKAWHLVLFPWPFLYPCGIVPYLLFQRCKNWPNSHHFDFGSKPGVNACNCSKQPFPAYAYTASVLAWGILWHCSSSENSH